MHVAMNRNQVTIGMVTIALSWYAMMAVHEAGHCLGALATGAVIETVEIPLVGYSRTDVSGGRYPLAVAWAGPLFGALAPVLLLLIRRSVRRQLGQALQFFAGFCLLANGVYLGVGGFVQAGDCRDLLQYGAPLWLTVGFGLVLSVGGLYTWHRLGPFREWFART